jgi:hypothetical protein
MKYLLLLIISGALAVSGFGQTRNVLVGTNNAVVQPTNFWSADAVNARTGLGLGTAATNPATAFQPSSATLSNLATANGGSLTNLQAASLIGLIPASNIPSVTFTNIAGVLAVTSGGTGATNAADARQNLGSTTVGDAVFVATNAAAARTALSLGTAATSAITDFQPANANLTNLSTNNGASLTGIPISGVVNLQSNLDAKLATNGNGSGLTSLTAANINGTVALASNITGTAALATNVTGTVALANGGTGATNASGARTALGASTVGDNLFTLINPSAIRFLRLNADNTATALSASDFRTAIGLSTAATNAESAFQPASTNLTTLAGNNGANLTNIPLSGVVGALATNGNGAGLTNLTAANIAGTVALASNVNGIVAVTNGGTGATNATTARTNLGLGWSALTNTNEATALLGYNATNGQVVYTNTNTLTISGNFSVATNAGSFLSIGTQARILRDAGSGNLLLSANAGTQTLSLATNGDVRLSGVLKFVATTNTPMYQAETRTNLGLPWGGLTNTNAATFQTALFGANTNPVLVDTNGEVLSPTNFWQAAPITTTFIESQPTTNSSTNIAGSRFLHIHSLATNIVNVTNTIVLPTNGSTFVGDVALVVHQGPTSSMTRVRTAGSTNDLVTMTRFDESVEFTYYNNVWQFNHNMSFVEPIYFSGTNAAGHAAESRTNLGLGATWLTNTNVTNFRTAIELGATNNVTFNSLAVSNAALTRTNLGIPLAALTNTSNANFRNAIELGTTNNVSFSNVTASGTLTATGAVTFVTNLNVGGAIAVTNAAETRTNLGIPLAALTNTSNTSFQAAVFTTNAAPTNTANVNGVGFNTAVGWMDVTLNIGGTNQVFRIPLFQ